MNGDDTSAEGDIIKQDFITILNKRLTCEHIEPRQVYHEEYEKLIVEGVDLSIIPTFPEVSQMLTNFQQVPDNPPNAAGGLVGEPASLKTTARKSTTKRRDTARKSITKKRKGVALLEDYTNGNDDNSGDNYYKHWDGDFRDDVEAANTLTSLSTQTFTDHPTYQCPHCDQTYPEQPQLTTHVQCVHEKVKNYICPECSKAFYTQNNLDIHTLMRHTGELPYTCSMCDYTCGSNEALTKHVQCVHEEKTHRCQLCKKGFRSKEGLNSHMRGPVHKDVDGGLVELECKLCDRKFSRSTLLNAHLKNEHGGSDG